MFDALYQQRAAIESAFGAALDWRRLEEKKASIVGFATQLAAHDRATWPEAIAWMVEHVRRLHSTFSPYVPKLRTLIRTA